MTPVFGPGGTLQRVQGCDWHLPPEAARIALYGLPSPCSHPVPTPTRLALPSAALQATPAASVGGHPQAKPAGRRNPVSARRHSEG